MKKKKIIIGIICVLILLPFILIPLSRTKKEETIKLTYDTVKTVPDTYYNNKEYNGLFDSAFSSNQIYNTSSDAIFTEDYYEDVTNSSTEYSNASDSLLLDNKKLKKTYNYKVETTNYDEFVTELEQNIQENNGVIDSVDEDTRTQNNSTLTETYKVRQGVYTIKIPADISDEFVETFESNAEIIYKNNIIDDVTTQYIDLDTHIAALENEYEILQELLSQATNVTEIIEVRDRITSVEYQLESYNRQFEALKDDIEYSTINLTINEVIYYTDTVEHFSSEIAENWAYIFENWLTDVIPTAFFMLLTFIPFILVVCAVIMFMSNIILKMKQKHKHTIYIQKEDNES